jgi:hypothetical protein
VTGPFIPLHRVDDGVRFWINAAHIVMVTLDKGNTTRIWLDTGEKRDLYAKESPDQVAALANGAPDTRELGSEGDPPRFRPL